MNTQFIVITLILLISVLATNQQCDDHTFEQCQLDSKCFWDSTIQCMNNQECSSLDDSKCKDNSFCKFKTKKETSCNPKKFDCSKNNKDSCLKDTNCKWNLTPKCISNSQFTMRNCYFMDEQECKNNQYHCQFQNSCEDDLNACQNLTKEQCIKSNLCIFKINLNNPELGKCKQQKPYSCEQYKIEECNSSNNCFKYSSCSPKYLPFCNQLDIQQCGENKHCKIEEEGNCTDIDIQCSRDIEQCEKQSQCILQEKTYHSCQNKLQCISISKDNCNKNPDCHITQGKCFSKNILYENTQEIISQKFHLYYNQ